MAKFSAGSFRVWTWAVVVASAALAHCSGKAPLTGAPGDSQSSDGAARGCADGGAGSGTPCEASSGDPGVDGSAGTGDKPCAAADGACADAGPSATPGPTAEVLLTATVAPTLGRVIPAQFGGLSIEYGIDQFFDEGMLPAAMFKNLLANLGKGNLRIGGASEDSLCWTSSSPRCQGTITLDYLKKLFAVASSSGWSLVMGTNLLINDPQNTVDFATTIASLSSTTGVQVDAIEIGNEPDWRYTRGDGTRKSGYGVADHAAEFDGYISALRANASTKGLSVTGPAVTYKWVGLIGEWLDLVNQPKTSLPFVTEHMYQLVPCQACPADSTVPCTGCSERCEVCIPDPKNALSIQKQITVGHLLDEARMNTTVAQIQGYVDQAAKRGRTFRMAEMNSVNSCGVAGISDTMGAALWTLDVMFRFADIGIEGVNFHNSNGCPYNAIVADTNVERPPARSPYYGLLMFSNAAGEHLLPVTRTGIQKLGDDADGGATGHAANVQVYATTACATCDAKVFIVNKDVSAKGDVLIVPPFAARSADALVLTAEGLSARESSITYGGVQVDRATGKLPLPKRVPVAADAKGNLRVTVPMASAVMLTLHRT